MTEPIDLQYHRFKRSMIEREGINEKIKQDLTHIWSQFENLDACDMYFILLENLINLALDNNDNSESIVEGTLLNLLTECETKDRVNELLRRAWNLLDSGDEEAGEKLNEICKLRKDEQDG